MNSDTDDLNADTLRPEDELRLLKDRAKLLNIPTAGNIGVDALKRRIAAKLAGSPEAVDELEGAEEVAAAKAPVKARAKTKMELAQEIRDEIQRTQLALVRCRIHNLNHAKRDLRGEIITVANRFLGTVRKFIPFGDATDGGYHIPRCIYEDLVSRQFQQISTKTVRGQIKVETRIVPEYHIEVLPALTKAELSELALTQQAAKRVNAE